MAVTNQELFNIFLANPNMSDAQIVSLMEQRGISPEQVSSTFNIPVKEIATRIDVAAPRTDWDYNKYVQSLKSSDTDYQKELKKVGGVMGLNAQNIYNEILAQQSAGTAAAWYRGNTASEKAAAADFALRLAENNVGSLKDLKNVESKDAEGKELINATTGERLPRQDLLGKGTKALDLDYLIQFTPDGTALPYTSNRKSGFVEFRDDFLKPAAFLALAAYGLGGAELFSGAAGAAGATAITAAEAAGLGLTAAEAATLGLSATEFAAASAAATSGGLLTGGATAAEAATAFELANAGIAGGTASFTPAQLALIEAGATAAEVAAAGANSGLLTKAATDATAFELQNAGASALTDLSATTQAGLLTGGKTAAELAAEQLAFETQNAGASALTNTGVKTAAELAAEQLAFETQNAGASALTNTGVKTAAELAAEKVAADAITAKAVTDAALAKKIADTASLLTGGLKTVGGLLQTEEDKAAAKLAADKVTAATQAGVEASQFRPIGMTTRFGTSEYKYDPVTGRMTSAGYQLSPEARAAQDRFVKLAYSGLQQADDARGQFAPLQTGAQSLFGLGNQYISQSPQDVAQNYINQQMALLQPSRETELANLQNRLFQQGRTGVSVAQGGTMGATTPELQALYNARAQQELQLAANAQQAGQQNVLFGSNLLTQGAQAMGNYYGGQQAAYSPYTTALGQIQALETAAQQPLTMGANLAQQASTAGFNAGRLGLQGASAAGELLTGKAATTNPYASLFAGISDPVFAQSLAKQIWGV